jgi:hypothetical protein
MPIQATRIPHQRLHAWVPPACPTDGDIDWIAVERAATGGHPRPRLTDDELKAAVLVLDAHGVSDQKIADRLGTSKYHVVRWRYASDALTPARACTVEGCTRVRKAHGLCEPHYKQRQRHPRQDDRPAPVPPPARERRSP